MVINYRHMQEKQTTEDGAEKATGSPPPATLHGAAHYRRLQKITGITGRNLDG